MVAVVLLSLLGALTWRLPATTSDGRSAFSAGHVVGLTAITLANPLGAGLVGAFMGGMRRRSDPRRRVFNVAVLATTCMVAGLAYDLVGGSFDLSELRGARAALFSVALPMLVADAVYLLVNAVLVAGVIRITAGVPLRLQVVDMLTSSGIAQFAYGVIAILVVLMWQPGRLGPVALLVGLAPLAGARWALVQYGEERNARERALGALVSAIETRAPSLTGHGGRVSELGARMAQALGLGPQQVADVRTAGLLHDLGRVVVAPGYDDADGATSAARREAEMLRELPFLSGATLVMQEVALGDSATTPRSLGAEIVLAADAYDLLTHGETAVPSTQALASLRVTGRFRDERILSVLEAAVRDPTTSVGAR
ncbi:HD domain-containing protein [Knoellia remsis]|nr:HD domain-containing protein [Knoellia remsis]